MPNQNNNNLQNNSNFNKDLDGKFFNQVQQAQTNSNNTPILQNETNIYQQGLTQNQWQTVYMPQKTVSQSINSQTVLQNAQNIDPAQSIYSSIQNSNQIPIQQPTTPHVNSTTNQNTNKSPFSGPILNQDNVVNVQNSESNSKASTITHPTSPQQSTNNPLHTYSSPSSIQIPQKPKDYFDLKNQVIQAQKPLPEAANIYPDQYDKLETTNTKIEINTHEILKLCIYVIPAFPIFILLLKFTNDDEVLWHTRQSTLAQTLWLIVLYILNSMNAPLISGSGFTIATLWNFICIGFLIYAGAQAYMGKKYRIPLVSEIGTGFIDNKS